MGLPLACASPEGSGGGGVCSGSVMSHTCQENVAVGPGRPHRGATNVTALSVHRRGGFLCLTFSNDRSIDKSCTTTNRSLSLKGANVVCDNNLSLAARMKSPNSWGILLDVNELFYLKVECLTVDLFCVLLFRSPLRMALPMVMSWPRLRRPQPKRPASPREWSSSDGSKECW